MTPTNDAPVTVEQCDREAAADHLAALGQINAQFRIRTGMADEHSLVQTLARHRLAALASAPAEPLPDIGPDPFKGPREDDRYEGSRLRLRAAYVQQQKGVPDQTALVWRYDLGTVLEMAIRLKSILADEEPASAPAGDGVEQCVTKIMDERATYFDRTTGHFDRADAARSYRATKAELLKGLAALACPRSAVAPAGDAPCEHESWEVDGAGRRTYCVDCREYLGPVPADQVADAGKPIAPVGDGVEALAKAASLAVADAAYHLKKYRPHVLAALEEALAAYDAAALARPRAAVAEQSREAYDALVRARDLAMRMTVEARIPECGSFGAIAQDLDAILALQSPPAKVEG